MSIHKNDVTRNFTKVSNSILQDRNLSLKDKGLLVTLLSLSEGWNFSIKGLSAIVPEEEYAITSSFNRLKQLGYVKTDNSRKSGRFNTDLFIENNPRTDIPDTQSL